MANFYKLNIIRHIKCQNSHRVIYWVWMKIICKIGIRKIAEGLLIISNIYNRLNLWNICILLVILIIWVRIWAHFLQRLRAWLVKIVQKLICWKKMMRKSFIRRRKILEKRLFIPVHQKKKNLIKLAQKRRKLHKIK